MFAAGLHGLAAAGPRSRVYSPGHLCYSGSQALHAVVNAGKVRGGACGGALVHAAAGRGAGRVGRAARLVAPVGVLGSTAPAPARPAPRRRAAPPRVSSALFVAGVAVCCGVGGGPTRRRGPPTARTPFSCPNQR